MPKLRLMPFEKEFVLSNAKFITLMGGRGCGKSHAIQARMKWQTTRYPKFRMLYVTPLSVQHDEVFNEMVSDPEFRKFIKGRPRSRPYCKIKLKNGSQVWMRSCKIWDALRSTGEDEIICDETQDSQYREEKVKQVLFPMIGRRISPAGGRGVIIFSGQFRGDDWRYEYWLKGQPPILQNTGIPEMDGKPNQKSRQPLYFSQRIPSSAGYAYNTPGGKEELEFFRQEINKATWDQEWDAIPRSNANAAFDAAEIDLISTKRKVRIEREHYPRRAGGYVLCIDVGGIKDPTKWLLGHISGEIVNGGALTLGLHDRQMARECMTVAKTFNAAVIVDATGGGRPGETAGEDRRIEFYEAEARAHGLPFHPVVFGGQGRKDRFVINMRTSIQEKWIGVAFELKEVCDEWKAYECHFKKPINAYSYGSPEGRHDDYVQCGMLFVEALRCGWIPGAGRGVLASLTY